jgi:hypothetical protein
MAVQKRVSRSDWLVLGGNRGRNMQPQGIYS